ncbi:catalase/peroxidase HPI [Sandarakinorhabdus oryzae]|uniref:catalase/peroxidase HPI n=1 Tax=Sandarakinorhabdus oryzae TaxID=2675220 RepID=UPI0012E0CEBB|nr:catalase/peroxidase HPI [Sandarakinorhabdus oryzae]
MSNRFVSLVALAIASLGATGAAAMEANMNANTSNQFWWPELVDLSPLRQQAPQSNPYGPDFDYGKEFLKLDLKAVKADIAKVLTTSQPWWPADYGNYGPFFIRMAWHSAGTYRIGDGRGGAGGGQQRFEPLNSWPDNGNLDKARRLLWPVKAKYGRALSWADLMVLAGNVSLETMGFKTFGFAGGRADDWEADKVYWGPENKMLDDKRYSEGRKLANPLGAVQMGLIYVNPEGPNGVPDPMAAAHDIRETFGRMAMNDEETAALIAGGHTFGKAHGAASASNVGKEPAAESLEKQGFGWENKHGTGVGADAITSGLEGAWSASPTQWTMQYLENLYGNEWVQTRSPAGAIQWEPKDAANKKFVPDAHREGVYHAPIMFTTDLALRTDPSYKKITQGWLKNPKAFEDAFARAWFKLTHRDMGPHARYLGPDAPKEVLSWQDPVPPVDHPLVTDVDVASLKQTVLASGLTVPELVRTAWAAAASYRNTDMRGGVNGGRLRLAPQKDWAVNNPAELAKVLPVLSKVQTDFNKAAPGGRKISLADLIVLAGNAAVEKAAADAGVPVTLSFTPGRTDASQAQTDVDSFSALEPKADGFRNYWTAASPYNPTQALVDRANLLGVTVPEMTALVGGLRALDANAGGSKVGVFTARPGVLTNDWFVNLLSMDTKWQKSATDGLYDGVDRATGAKKWTASPVDLLFGSHSELRAVAEVYGASDGHKQLVQDFAKAWTKVMNKDRLGR